MVDKTQNKKDPKTANNFCSCPPVPLKVNVGFKLPLVPRSYLNTDFSGGEGATLESVELILVIFTLLYGHFGLFDFLRGYRGVYGLSIAQKENSVDVPTFKAEN